jgi:hypothetical protein
MLRHHEVIERRDNGIMYMILNFFKLIYFHERDKFLKYIFFLTFYLYFYLISILYKYIKSTMSLLITNNPLMF